jgi:hypothetical protein
VEHYETYLTVVQLGFPGAVIAKGLQYSVIREYLDPGKDASRVGSEFAGMEVDVIRALRLEDSEMDQRQNAAELKLRKLAVDLKKA